MVKKRRKRPDEDDWEEDEEWEDEEEWDDEEDFSEEEDWIRLKNLLKRVLLLLFFFRV